MLGKQIGFTDLADFSNTLKCLIVKLQRKQADQRFLLFLKPFVTISPRPHMVCRMLNIMNRKLAPIGLITAETLTHTRM